VKGGELQDKTGKKKETLDCVERQQGIAGREEKTARKKSLIEGKIKQKSATARYRTV